MNKKTLSFIALLAVALIIFVVVKPTENTVLGEGVSITQFNTEGTRTGNALVRVPMLRSTEETRFLSLGLDLNGDGEYLEEEWVILDVPVRPHANWGQGFYFSYGESIPDDVETQVILVKNEGDTNSVEELFTRSSVITEEVGDLLGLSTVTNPEEAMKGWGIHTAHAHGDITSITNDDVPDIRQRIGECAPTAAANSLISLINRHGEEDDTPSSNDELIEDLKSHMRWTPENGVLPDDFVRGKNEWAAAQGLPIRTEKVGDKNGLTTIDAIKEALGNGQAVELRIAFADSSLRAVGGHMVTVTGIHQGEGQTYLDINDPKTADSGTETVEIRQNQITNYGPWEGITVLSWAFTQTWEGSPTGVHLDEMSQEEINALREFTGEAVAPIKVIRYRGEHIPISQLRVGEIHPAREDGGGCPERHWHADEEVESVEGRTFKDPKPDSCGFGVLSQNPSIDYIPN